MSENSTDPLRDLSARYGVATEYTDWRGRHINVAPETLTAVLAALGVDASSPGAVDVALTAAEERPWRRAVPPTTVVRDGESVELRAHVPDGTELRVALELEGGATLPLEQLENWEPARIIDGSAIGEASFRIPADIPHGWHRVVATTSAVDSDGAAVDSSALALLGFERPAASRRSRRGVTTEEGAERTGDEFIAAGSVIVVPAALDASALVPEPAWGLMAQLYQARSEGSWGIGDLGDLSTLSRWGAERNADFVLVNPFHAPAPVTPIEPSPYLPTSRRFIDPSLIRIDDIEVELDEAVSRRITELGSYARATSDGEQLDRDRVWMAKREALGLCFDAARHGDGEPWRAFGDFVEAQGEALIDFATWCVLAELFGADWRLWPEELRDPSASAVQELRAANELRIEFYSWLQWVAREQGRAVQEAATSAGMRIGVMHDLAVGVHPSGADAWALDRSLARGVTVGAPPDAFNQLGQNWSQPPLRPDQLERTGYAPLRDMLRAAFVGAGALRIDHILGFFRLWWIPEGAGADRGTYVAYDHEAMIGILLLEAERAGAVVIGEDLGVVSDLTREVMAERHVFGTQIMWFEHEPDGSPRDPSTYREECLVTVTTHDLPPTAGYIELAHVDLRERLGLLTQPVEELREAERAEVEARVAQLRAAGLVGENPSTDEVVIALHALIARSRSRLFGVSLADLAGDRRAINQPGTYREYPNWSLPLVGADGLSVGLEQILTSPFADALASASQRVRTVQEAH